MLKLPAMPWLLVMLQLPAMLKLPVMLWLPVMLKLPAMPRRPAVPTVALFPRGEPSAMLGCKAQLPPKGQSFPSLPHYLVLQILHWFVADTLHAMCAV